MTRAIPCMCPVPLQGPAWRLRGSRACQAQLLAPLGWNPATRVQTVTRRVGGPLKTASGSAAHPPCSESQPHWRRPAALPGRVDRRGRSRAALPTRRSAAQTPPRRPPHPLAAQPQRPARGSSSPMCPGPRWRRWGQPARRGSTAAKPTPQPTGQPHRHPLHMAPLHKFRQPARSGPGAAVRWQRRLSRCRPGTARPSELRWPVFRGAGLQRARQSAARGTRAEPG